MSLKKFTVNKEDSGQRLDLYLAVNQNEFSRSALRKNINDGNVKVNDNVEYRPNYKVKDKDKIDIEIEKSPSEVDLEPEDIDLDIVYESDNLIVVNKPVDMVVHPATGNWRGTLMNAIMHHFKDMGNVGDNIRSGLIHRLDKGTSGLVLVGKTNKGLWYYSKQFAERKVSKTYMAVVIGDLSETIKGTRFEVKNYLGRNPIQRKKYTEVSEHSGKLAHTIFNVVNVVEIEGKIFTLVKAKPITGRTHQIRVHLNGLGHPILGDKTYGRKNEYGRLMLHAWKIEITLLSGKKKIFVSDIPNEFKRFE